MLGRDTGCRYWQSSELLLGRPRFLSDQHVYLSRKIKRTREMDVHLITIEIGIVGVTCNQPWIPPATFHSPVGVVHSDSFLSKKHLDLVRHHTRFMQSGLPVENNDISVSDMSIHLFVSRRWAGRVRKGIALRGQQLVGDRCSLFKSCPVQ